ncbi:FAD-dependent oxidoreductase [Alienimonas californiensis]|uniref:Gamma-glutamylputrescine oxidoreductase n=1 Tax=Alienimonas californiensis TaxID=2527989 RepID=A0A517PE04_9PLAN|nr:FAD-dependent oxidoreductase [Alienimonas californiensis]QDT17606.1 Gamma-glutamylputrescine oxidoreductase [Alienimonas californiensis]
MTSIPRGEAYWNATAEAPDFPTLSGDVSVDVAVIGGGIVGITAARLFKDRGLTVAVVEAQRVGRQVTGRSTAKVSSQHGLIYQKLEKNFGEERARLYGEAQEAAVRMIRQLAAEHGIDCDLEDQAAYTYTREEKQVSQIEDEVKVAQKLGLPATLVRQTDLPFDVLAANRFDGQAQFHPTKYVAGLAGTVPGDGSHVFERSRAVDWEPTRVVTDQGVVTARHVVMATHLPLGQVGGYYAQAHPMAEPVVAARVKGAPEGMYLSVDKPSHSYRAHRNANGETYAIVAGNSFKPGHTDEERQSVEDVERWLNENFDAGPIEYRWVNEDYSSIDNAPFIGWSSSIGEGYLVATGFNAWGISNGTAAGMILADLVEGRENPWTSLFDATRVKPVAGGPKFVKENLSVAAHLVTGYLSRRPKSYDELEPGDAAIMEIDGEKVAAFKDEQGVVHAVSAVCSHMGCIVGWNETDRTWDCPCHGSRFELSGEATHGPATQPLGAPITG